MVKIKLIFCGIRLLITGIRISKLNKKMDHRIKKVHNFTDRKLIHYDDKLYKLKCKFECFQKRFQELGAKIKGGNNNEPHDNEPPF